MKRCIVPRLVGLALPAARTAAAKANCRVGKVTYVKGPARLVGKVLVAPRVGTRLTLNAQLALRVGAKL